MAYGKDLTLQMSLLLDFERTIYVTFLLFFGKYLQSSFRENTASVSQVSRQNSLKSIIWKHVWIVTSSLSGICERLCYVLLKEHHIYNLQCATFCLETERVWCKSRLSFPQMV